MNSLHSLLEAHRSMVKLEGYSLVSNVRVVGIGRMMRMEPFSLKDHVPKPSYDLTMDLIMKDINNVPEVAAVYVMVGHNGDYIYTGRTKNLRTRFHFHLKLNPNMEVLDD